MDGAGDVLDGGGGGGAGGAGDEAGEEGEDETDECDEDGEDNDEFDQREASESLWVGCRWEFHSFFYWLLVREPLDRVTGESNAISGMPQGKAVES